MTFKEPPLEGRVPSNYVFSAVARGSSIVTEQNKRFLARVSGVFVSVLNTPCQLFMTIQELRFLHCTSSREQSSSLGLQYTSEANSVVLCSFTLRAKHTCSYTLDSSAATRTDSSQGNELALPQPERD